VKPVGVMLRVIATVIAVAGAIDPAFTSDVVLPQEVSIVAIGDESVGAAADLRRRLNSDVEARVRVHRAPSRAAACPTNGRCVVVSNGTSPDRLTAGATVVGAVKTPKDAPNAIVDIDAPSRVPLNAASLVRVKLSTAGPRVEVLDEGTRIGVVDRAEAEVVDVPVVPIADGPRLWQVKVGEAVADLSVVVTQDRGSVLVYEPAATWAGTFVRRALADDVRFRLEGRTQVAPPVAITRGVGSRLTVAALDSVGAVVLTVPDSLRRPDVDLLARFVRHRGGSLVVILDRKPLGPVLQLLPRAIDEHREAEPTLVDALRATETIAFDTGLGSTVLGKTGERAVVVAQALGRGRVIVSGALDAWKYRDDAFDAFWRSLVWDATVAAGPTVRVTPRPGLVEPHQRVRVEVELQTLRPLAPQVEVEGRYTCASESGALRLWPEPRPGVFAGSFHPRAAGDCQVVVIADGISAATSLAVKDRVRTVIPSEDRLEGAIAAHGGIVVSQGDEGALLERLRQSLPRDRESRHYYPMRTPWWLVPFVACLSGEWLLRRRAGAH
jgi:hypothetical protein